MIRTFKLKKDIRAIAWTGDNIEEIKEFTNAISCKIYNNELRIQMTEDRGFFLPVNSDIKKYVVLCGLNYRIMSEEQINEEIESGNFEEIK